MNYNKTLRGLNIIPQIESDIINQNGDRVVSSVTEPLSKTNENISINLSTSANFYVTNGSLFVDTSNISTSLGNLQTSINKINSTISSINLTTNSLLTNINKINETTSSLLTTTNSLLTYINNINNTISSINLTTNSLQTSIVNINSSIGSINSSIASIIKSVNLPLEYSSGNLSIGYDNETIKLTKDGNDLRVSDIGTFIYGVNGVYSYNALDKFNDIAGLLGFPTTDDFADWLGLNKDYFGDTKFLNLKVETKQFKFGGVSLLQKPPYKLQLIVPEASAVVYIGSDSLSLKGVYL